MRSLKYLLVATTLLIAGGIALWNWPAGFYRSATWLGRIASGIELRQVVVMGRETPTLVGAASDGPDAQDPDGRPILFLHGWGTSKEAMMGQMRWFSAGGSGRMVIAPDLPGFGDNQLLADQPALSGDDYVQWIEEFRRACGIDRLDLVGESMGGALAAAYAAKHPDRVGRLILEAAAGVRPPRTNEFMAAIERGENPLRIADEADFDRVLDLCFARRPPVPRPFKEFMIDRAVAVLDRQDEMVAAMKGFLLSGNEGHLGSISAPTLVIYGSEDRITDPSMLRVYVDGIPGAHGELLEGAGHVVFYDSPARTRKLVTEFLSR